jgi:hypothetical protein
MTRVVLILALLVSLSGCAPATEESSVTVTRRGDLRIESRTLTPDATLAAVGLGPEGDRAEGDATWDDTFADAPGRRDRDAVARDFRLQITNRAATAREFHARIDYLAPDGALVRRRELDHLVVAPFTEIAIVGSVRLPLPGDAAVLARVLPSSEPFDVSAEEAP